MMVGSPGGSVFGISDAAEAVRKVCKVKPIYAYSSKNAASGAYWLASCATTLIGSPESEWGSIGVIVSHFSYEKQLEQEGIKVTVLRSDELKAVGGPYTDLTDKEVAHIQEQVDTYDDLFKQHVLAVRPQVKLRQMKAQTFIGDEAKQMGLIDAVMSYDQTIDYIKSQRKPITQVGGYNMKLTAETLKVALDAGKTLEDLGITQEEMEAIMATDVTAEPGESAVDGEDQQDPGVVEPDAGGEGLDASAEMKLVIEQQQIEITTLIEQKDQLEAAATEMKEIVIGVLNNRRVALGLTKIEMGAFSLPSILADYKAVSAEFDKSFKTGGVFKQKPEETKTVSVATDRAHAGLLQAAA
jgi:signal peptide peptidase SppA